MITLPITVDVSGRGHVSIETPTRLVAMSPFSERAARLARDLGTGVHVITDAADVSTDIAEALS